MNSEFFEGVDLVCPENESVVIEQLLAEAIATELPAQRRWIRRMLGRGGLALALFAGAAGAESSVYASSAEAAATDGDYPHATASDCSAQLGSPYSWCVDEDGNGRYTAGEDLSARGYGYRNCTDWAAVRAQQLTGKLVPNNLGNANTWDDRVANIPGAVKDSVPEAGDVAQSNGGAFGHVGVVESVTRNAAGSITSIAVSEYNKAGTGLFSSSSYPAENGTFWRDKSKGLAWDNFIDLDGPGTAQSAVNTKKIPGDFDGNTLPEAAVFRPGTGVWHERGVADVAYGQAGDIPVPGFWDADATFDEAVYRPTTNTWHIRGIADVTYGKAGDIPVPADYDGDGKTDIAVYRPTTGEWLIRNQGTAAFGQTGDVPVPGNYNSDKKADIAVFRPSTGGWHVRGIADVAYGQAGDIPVPADFDGDGMDNIAVFRPGNGSWYVRGQQSPVAYGQSGDIPVPVDFNNDGRSDMAVFRPSAGAWHIRNIGSIAFGATGDVPVTAMQNRAALKQLGLVQ